MNDEGTGVQSSHWSECASPRPLHACHSCPTITVAACSGIHISRHLASRRAESRFRRCTMIIQAATQLEPPTVRKLPSSHARLQNPTCACISPPNNRGKCSIHWSCDLPDGTILLVRTRNLSATMPHSPILQRRPWRSTSNMPSAIHIHPPTCVFPGFGIGRDHPVVEHNPGVSFA